MKAQWALFIDTYLIKNDHIAAYQSAYPGTSRQTAATKGKALLLKDEIRNRILPAQKRKGEIIAAVRNDAIAETAAKGKILSEMEIDEILSRIASGTHEVYKVFMIGGVPTRIKVPPDHSDMVNALDKLNRTQGRYISDKKNPKDPATIAERTLDELKADLEKSNRLLNE